MLILTADDVRKALPMKEAIEAMKNAYAASFQREGCGAASDGPSHPRE